MFDQQSFDGRAQLGADVIADRPVSPYVATHHGDEPLSWPELQQSIFDFEALIEEEAQEFRQSLEEPDKPPVILPTLAGSQRLHLIQGRPWKYALGDFMADARDGQCWFASKRFTRGDLLLSVLEAQPPVLLCLERARTKPKGPSIDVGTGGLYFHRLVPVQVIEGRAGVTLPHAPATLRKKVAAAVLDAMATELSNPTEWLDAAVGRRSGAGCRIPTGVQAAALMAAQGVCQACGRDFGALLDGRGIAGLEVHDLGGLANSSDNTDDDADPQSDRRAELSAKTLKALRKLAIAAGFAAEEVSTADRDEIIESLICDELAAEDNGNNEIPPEEDDEYGPFTGAEGQPAFVELFASTSGLRRHLHGLLEAAAIDAAMLPAELTPGRRARRFVGKLAMARIGVELGADAGSGHAMASRSAYHEIRGLGWDDQLLHATVFNRRHPMMEVA